MQNMPPAKTWTDARFAGAKKKELDPSGATPIKGGSRRKRHGGVSPQAKAAAARSPGEGNEVA